MEPSEPTKSASPAAPWWSEPAYKPKRTSIPLGSAIALAVIAGLVGSAVGDYTTNGTLLGHRINLVSASNTIERAPESVAGIARRVLPSVVSITTETASGGATGSGFVIESSGYILTNNHVVDGATGSNAITVALNDGRSMGATIVGTDSAYDLAVLKISASNLPALQFGDSDKIQVGDSVIAVGSPLGLSGTVTSGIISAKNRAVSAGGTAGESSFINALQTDAAINPGNSGGPLVDATGAVIGVNSAIASLGSSTSGQSGSIGLGFAIPINQARKTANQLIKTGKATYPIIGISLDLKYSQGGAKITNTPNGIHSGGPAAAAGLQPGDIITKFDGKVINGPDELIVAVRAKNVGDKVTLTYLRDGTSHQVSLKLAPARP
jgi:putative serine protease PepD